MTHRDLRPVERACVCPAKPPARAIRASGHVRECDDRHAATFFATVAMVRADLKAERR